MYAKLVFGIWDRVVEVSCSKSIPIVSAIVQDSGGVVLDPSDDRPLDAD